MYTSVIFIYGQFLAISMAYTYKTQSILYIDHDEDDHLLIGSLLQEIAPQRPIHYFTRAEDALIYLTTIDTPPFLIMSTLQLPGMSGIELQQRIQDDALLRRFSIPFVFLASTLIDGLTDRIVDEAFSTAIQGFFEKKISRAEQYTDLKVIIDYWDRSHHSRKENLVNRQSDLSV